MFPTNGEEGNSVAIIINLAGMGVSYLVAEGEGCYNYSEI